MADVMLGYFDPGSGSILLQLLVGGSASILVFGRYLWQRLFSRYSPQAAPESSAEFPAFRG
ncbi:MAG: hypothetical protein U0903_15875 [Planctomycetales bacterium]